MLNEQPKEAMPLYKKLLVAAAAAIAVTSVVGKANLVSQNTAPSEVAQFSDPNQVDKMQEQGFPVPVRQEEVTEADTSPIAMVNRLEVNPEDRAAVQAEIAGQVGGAGSMNAGEEVDIPASNYQH